MKKSLTFGAILLAFTLLASPALADSGQQRGGLFLSLGGFLGGGAPSYKDGIIQINNEEKERKFDGGVSVGAGLGLGDTFVVGGDLMWIGQKYKTSLTTHFLHNINALANLDVFFFGGFVVGGGIGLAYYHVQSDVDVLITKITKKNDGVGWGFRLSAGYEAFVSSDFAFGARFFYLRNGYDKLAYDSLGANLSLRWY